MHISSITIHEIQLDLRQFFETSFARVTCEHFLLLEVNVEGVTGWSECVASEAPSYSSETVKTSLHIIEDFIAPHLFNRDFQHPDEILPLLHHIRGHNMAKAAVEMGCWDAFSRIQGEPLSKTLGGTRAEIVSGVSIGIQDSVEQLLEKINLELEDGYQRIKLKIKPGWDIDVIQKVRQQFPDLPLMVDANCAYSLVDVDLFRAMDEYNLTMIEQPLHYSDMWDHAKLQEQIDTPICLDESIHSADDARKAIEMGATKIINIKPGRLGGLSSARDVHSVALEHNIPVWCGGMLESGIGRAHNVHLSTLPNFILPGDVADSKRYFVEELIEPTVQVRKNGTIEVPKGPGIGYTVKIDRIKKHRISHRVLNPA